MGDPSLRLHPAKPLENLTVVNSDEGPILNWEPQIEEEVLGYHIYRSDTISGKFSRINTAPIVGTTFLDDRPLYGRNVYMVRGIKLEVSASGTYYNLTPGVIAETESFIITDTTKPPEIDWKISPNPARDKILLEINNSGFGKIFLEIFNNLGQNVLSMQINSASTVINEEIDLSFLNSGIFFAVLKGSNFTVSQKFILR